VNEKNYLNLILKKMRNKKMNLSEIGGRELNNNEKQLLKGGDEDEQSCHYYCFVHDQYEQIVMEGQCCGNSLLEVRWKCGTTYEYEGWHCHCYELYDPN
jgi:hypothetical protein